MGARREILKRIIIPLLIALALTSQASAQQMPHGQGVLWQIQTPSGGKTNFLFGIMHSTDPGITTLPEDLAAGWASTSIELGLDADLFFNVDNLYVSVDDNGSGTGNLQECLELDNLILKSGPFCD